MFEEILTTLRVLEPTISSIVGLLTLCAAIWGALQLTFFARRRERLTKETADSAIDSTADRTADRAADRVADSPADRTAQSLASKNRKTSVLSGSWHSLMNLGLAKTSRLEELVSVRIVNVALFCVGGLSLPWLVISVTSLKATAVTAITLFVFVSALLGFVLQWSGSKGASRWLLLVSAAAYWMGILLAAGPMVGTEYFLAALVMLPVLIFSRAERLQTLLAIAMMLIVYALGLVLSQSVQPVFSPLDTVVKIGYFANAFSLAAIIFASVRYYKGFAASSYHKLERKRKQNADLVSSLFPHRIAKLMEERSGTVAEWHPDATVVYVSLTGVSQLYARMPAIELVEKLASIFARFDHLAQQHGVDKVKTLGTTYVAATGIGGQSVDRAVAASFVLAMQQSVADFAVKHRLPLSLRCGLATGLVISGVIADTHPRFDIWGEALEAAAVMCLRASDGEVYVSQSAFWRFDDRFEMHSVDGDVSAYRLIQERVKNEQPASVS